MNGRRAVAAAAMLLGLTVAVGVGAQAAAEPPRGEIRLDVELAPGVHTVGDRVAATLSLRVPAGSLAGEPRFPAWRPVPPEGGPADATAGGQRSWGDAEVVAAGPIEREERGETVIFRQRLVLAAFTPGRLPLPPIGVALPLAGGTIETTTPPDLALVIASVLPPPATAGAGTDRRSAEPAPRPPAPPRPLPLGTRFWWTAALGTLACLAALAWAYRRTRPARRSASSAAAGADPTARPDLSPFEELAAALEAARRAVPETGHALLSLAVRRYLGRRLRFPGPESSTSEVHRELTGRRLPAGVAVRAVDLLRACDLVKFARRRTDADALGTRAATALAVAREVEDDLRPRSSAGATEAA